MKLNCSQFEGLITFYLDGALSAPLTEAFEQHLKECQECNMKFKIIKSIIGDIKTAYSKIIDDNNIENCTKPDTKPTTKNDEDEYVTLSELSAYIDNELPDEHNVRLRRNIIARPVVRTKLERMYKLRKFLSNSFSEQKNRLKTDYSKEIIKKVNSQITPRQIYLHCTLFIMIVLIALVISVITILRVL